jgi:hypothetical protein
VTWLILILVLAVVIGPVMYLRPTAKDKRLTALRLAARQKGLIIKITRVPKLDASADERVSAGGIAKDATVGCAAYQMAIGCSLDNFTVKNELMLLAIPQAPSQHVVPFMPGWAQAATTPNDLWTRFRKLGFEEFLQSHLTSLPSDALAIGVDGRFVSCYWREQATVDDPALADIAGFLAAFKAWIIARLGVSEASPDRG